MKSYTLAKLSQPLGMKAHKDMGFDMATNGGLFGDVMPQEYGPKVYRLAKDSAHAVIPFGPLFTLDVGQYYQSQLIEGGFDTLLVNTQTGRGF